MFHKSQLRMGRIVVIGSSNTDMVVQVPHLPAAGETVLGTAFHQVAGGKGANQTVAAARAGGVTPAADSLVTAGPQPD